MTSADDEHVTTGPTFVRPPAEPAKLTDAWALWAAGDELPGRTLADLKTAGLDQIIETLAPDSTVAAAMAEPLNAWERGRVGPAETLDALGELGIGDLLAAIAESA